MTKSNSDQTGGTKWYSMGLPGPLKNGVRICLSIVFVFSILDLIGWVFDITAFKSISPAWIPMKPITALCFLLSAASLVIIMGRFPPIIRKNLPLIFTVFIILASATTIYTYLYPIWTGHEISSDRVNYNVFFLQHEMKMALLTACNFFLIGLVLLLLSTGKSTLYDIAYILIIPVSFSSYFIPVTYILGVYSLHNVDHIPVALNSGIAFCALCFSLLVIRQDSWLIRVFLSRAPGGIMARKLLPALIVLPVIIAWLRIKGERAAVFHSEEGVAIVAITYTICFLVLVWITAKSVNKIDSRRHGSEEALKKAYTELDKKVNERTEELLKLNRVLDAEITERRKAQKAVESERKRFNDVLELMPAYLILLTPEYRVTYANRFFRERFGEDKGRRCYEYLFDRTEPCEICETYKVLKENRPLTWEWTGPDGRNYSIFDFPFTDTDNSPLIMEMGIDVTDLKKAEAALTNLNMELEERVAIRTSDLVKANELINLSRQEWIETFDKIPDLIAIIDTSHRILRANKAMLDKLGISIQDAAGTPCYKCVHGTDSAPAFCPHSQTLRDNLQHISEIHEDNLGGDYLVSNTPLFDNKGILIGSVHVARDISDRIISEKKLAKHSEKLEILSEIASRLLLSDDPQQLINELCTKVMKFLDCQVFFNFLVENKAGKLHLNTFAGISEATAVDIEWVDYGEAVCGQAALERSQIVVENVQKRKDKQTRLIRSFGLNAYVCHPLMSRDKVIGTLSFGTKTRNEFSDDDISLLKAVSNQVAIAIARTIDEKILVESEEKYRMIFDGMVEGFAFHEIILDDKGKPVDYRFLSINPAFEKQTGLKAEDVIGKRVTEVLPNIEKYWIDIYGKVALTGEIVDFENFSSELESYFRVSVFSPKKGYFAAIFENVTARILAEKELYRTKTYLENLINYANAPVIVWNPDTTISLFNHAFEHLTGYSSSEVMGKKLDFLFPDSSLKESKAKIKNALTKNWETIEIPILTKNKEKRIVLWNSANIFDSDGKTVLSVIAQGNDITERIKAEQEVRSSNEKLDMALENASIGVWEWDLVTNRFEWDERMNDMFGLKSEMKHTKYEHFEKTIFKEDLPHFRKAVRDALDNNIPLDTVFRISGKNYDFNHISIKALVNYNASGNPVKMSGVCFDITGMKKGAEEAIFRLNEDLIRSNRELEQFAYVASHDLQEPLRMVSSFTQLLSMRYKDKLDSDANEYIKFAVDGAMRMQNLINDLLGYSRIGTRGKPLSPINTTEIAGQAIRNLTLKIAEVNGTVTCDDLPEITADGGQMVQLFQNLIENGIKFCKTTPKIHISARKESGTVIFSVRDNGIGIEPEYFSKIFQIFQRLHGKEDYTGTGIGLAICRRIVERHGGKIWVETSTREGSIFNFTIPNNKSDL